MSALLNISRNRIGDQDFLFGARLNAAGWIVQELPVILVVEDDQLIQGMVEEALTEGGFESVIASSGEEAAGLLEENHGRYRALITDVDLSGKLDGWHVAKLARESNPDIHVIYVTGAASDQWASRGVPNSVLLNKPFAPAQVVTAVAQLLNTTGPPKSLNTD